MSESRLSLRLSRLLHELRKAGFRCDDLPYRKVWQGAVEQRYPAHQKHGVWHFYPDDVPTIGAASGCSAANTFLQTPRYLIATNTRSLCSNNPAAASRRQGCLLSRRFLSAPKI